MITWYSDEDITIRFDRIPKIIDLRDYENNFFKKLFLKKFYMLIYEVNVFIFYNKQKYIFKVEKKYKWDGANVPFGFWTLIGKPSYEKFKIPSMIHDKVCENHYLINNDRYLSSLLLEKLLKASGVGLIKRKIMFFFTDLYQRFRDWDK